MRAETAQALITRLVAHADPAAARELATTLLPVVRARVARTVVRLTPPGRRRDLTELTRDLTQEILTGLFQSRAAALASWDPTRGLTLENFVGLIAERRVASTMASRRRNPWTNHAEAPDVVARRAGVGVAEPERRIAARELLLKLLERLQTSLDPETYRMFELRYVQQLSIREVCVETAKSKAVVEKRLSRLRPHLAALREELSTR